MTDGVTIEWSPDHLHQVTHLHFNHRLFGNNKLHSSSGFFIAAEWRELSYWNVISKCLMALLCFQRLPVTFMMLPWVVQPEFYLKNSQRCMGRVKAAIKLLNSFRLNHGVLLTMLGFVGSRDF